MMFMGEQWGSTAPFPFFCEFKGDLAKAIRAGRRREFAGAYAKYGDDIPDPLDVQTFRSAILDWQDCETPSGLRRLDLVRQLLAVRHREIVPRLADAQFGDATASDGKLMTAYWRLGSRSRLTLVANLCETAVARRNPSSGGTILWGSDFTDVFPPWAVCWKIES